MYLKLDMGPTISKLDMVAFMTLFTGPHKHNKDTEKSAFAAGWPYYLI